MIQITENIGASLVVLTEAYAKWAAVHNAYRMHATEAIEHVDSNKRSEHRLAAARCACEAMKAYQEFIRAAKAAAYTNLLDSGGSAGVS